MENDEKKPEPLTGQRRLESQYAKYEGTYQMLFVYLSLGTLAIIGFIFIGIIAPAREKRDNQALEDLEVLARAANLYRDERGVFPESLEELVTFSPVHWAEKGKAPSLKDPWKREYYYFKVSDDRAVFASSGRNRKLDLDRTDLSPPPEDGKGIHKLRDSNIFSYAPYPDDWIILAGSWPSRKP